MPRNRISQIIGLACSVISSGCNSDNATGSGYPAAIMMQECVEESDKEKLIEFLENCIRDSNPKSDEEPEDWIKQCELTGKSSICPYVSAVRSRPCANCYREDIPCAQIPEGSLKQYCPKE